MRSLCRFVAVAVAVGVLTPRILPAQSNTYEELQTFSGLLSQIRLNYVDSVSYSVLVRGAIEGVLHSLDPHSYYLSREDLQRRVSFEAGTLAGIGIELDDVDGMVVVIGIAPGSPASRGGLQPGDRLREVNDTAVAGVAVQALQSRMIGEKGTRVRLRLERGPRIQPQSVVVALKNEPIPPRSVWFSAPLDGQTGYLRLIQFFPETPREVETAIKKLERDQKTRRLILDLRGNPGGVVAAAAEVAGLFVPKGVSVLRLVGHAKIDNQEFKTEKDGPFTKLPLIVIVDENTASAAEALAGSLQDLDRALIVGRRTFGKALAQRPVPLPPRGDVVYLTVARAVTPSGRIIQRPYRDLTAEQYRQLAGRAAPSDSTATFHTARGRVVQGGGGVAPDITLPAPPPLPVWWTAAVNDWGESMLDSLANTLDPQSYASWKSAPAEWRDRLAVPFITRVRERLGSNLEVDSALTDRLAGGMAYRATQVRWGGERANEFALANDREIREAATYFGKIDELLARPAGP